MRTIGFRSNILFAIAAACGVVAALGRPWYAPSPASSDRHDVGQLPSQMEEFLAGIGRAFSDPTGATGWDALTRTDSLIAGLAIATGLLLVLTLVPPLQAYTQALARLCAMGTFAVVLVKLFDEPGANALTEPRYGLMVALGASAVLLASALHVAGAPVRKRTPPRTYTPPPAPVYEPEASYGPPQY